MGQVTAGAILLPDAPDVLPFDGRRARALAKFRAEGLPHRRIEDWKYSDLRGVAADTSVASENARLHIDHRPPGVEVFDLAQSGAPDWVRAHLGNITNDASAMGAASLAFAEVGVAIRIPKGLAANRAVELSYGGSGYLRVLLVLEQGASATLIERDADTHATARNISSEFVVGDNAQLTHVCLRGSGTPAVLVQEIAATVARGGVYRAHYAQRGARLSRIEVALLLDGEGAEANLSGVSLLAGETHADVTTHVEHAAGKTTSRQLFKDVAAGRSRVVYQGRITVREGANGSDSRQTAKALLLDSHAEADLKPELEIFADDVKCAHGAAVGDLDADSLFYMRARGISEAEARALLVRAFLDEALAEIAQDDLRAAAVAFVESGFAAIAEERA